jgi:hypothetical protein
VQQQSLIATLSDRIGKLEQERWTVTGRSSVSDPATSAALTDMAMAIKSLTLSERGGTGHQAGRNESWATLGVVASIIISIAAVAVHFVK